MYYSRSFNNVVQKQSLPCGMVQKDSPPKLELRVGSSPSSRFWKSAWVKLDMLKVHWQDLQAYKTH